MAFPEWKNSKTFRNEIPGRQKIHFCHEKNRVCVRFLCLSQLTQISFRALKFLARNNYFKLLLKCFKTNANIENDFFHEKRYSYAQMTAQNSNGWPSTRIAKVKIVALNLMNKCVVWSRVYVLEGLYKCNYESNRIKIRVLEINQ